MNGQEKERHEEAMFMSQRHTPLSDMSRAAWDSLLFQMPSKGLCPKGKCLLKEGHKQVCWPST